MGTIHWGERILVVFVSLRAIEKYKFNQGGDWFWHVICLRAVINLPPRCEKHGKSTVYCEIYIPR